MILLQKESTYAGEVSFIPESIPECLNQSIEPRKEFTRKDKLCNLCLGKGHFVQRCRSRDACLVAAGCGQRYHSLLDTIAHWQHLDGIEFPELKKENVTMIIGSNISEAHWVLEQKQTYAVKTLLGCRWSLHLSSAALPVCICELLQLRGD